MYATHLIVDATEFERRINDGRKTRVGYLVDMTQRGTLMQDRFIRVGGRRDWEWVGTINHFRLVDFPQHMDIRLVCSTVVVSPRTFCHDNNIDCHVEIINTGF